jgi:RES domain-containing protein
LSRTVWRIATDTPNYQADDLSGAGAKVTGGRWNAKGLSIVYTSETRALACLETIVHFNAGGLPLNRYLVELTIPDDVWANARVETSGSLPVGWDAEPAGQVSIQHGTIWARSGSSALLVVPSVIVQEEFNVLINPSHVDSARITAIKQRKWLYDPRLTKPA